MDIIIETKRLLIRKINSNDLEYLLEIYNNPQNMIFIPNSDFRWTKEKLKEKYDKINQDYKNGFGIYAVQIKNSDLIIGEAGLFNSFHDLKHLELGYILNNRFWRKGYGSEICNSLIDYGFRKLKLDKLTARMFKQNIASIKLSESCGMNLIKEGQTDNGDDFCEFVIKNIDL
ncbi:GNAT family N-acetyltransferase [uncultured Sunxiuqinia sp.]|uniref:GNAT family N-acetyltransferase n=1 Tax=uncultured Sunxiuqinia sp. TaxID=1573825 RepID=UPI002AA6ABF0|nr:GNAT family N-acetyltransferase [uncultured Sunxiuqinia sp.]